MRGRLSLFYDLRYPIHHVLENDFNENFKGRNRPFRIAKSAEMPLVFKKTELEHLVLLESYDFESLDALACDLKTNASIIDVARLRDESKEEFEQSPHIENQIYDNFEAFDRDRYLMENFHTVPPEEKMEVVRQFSDERFRSFGRRIIFESFREQMNEGEI